MFAYGPLQQVAITAAGEQFLGRHFGRRMLKVVNTGANPASIAFEANPGTDGPGNIVSFPLAAGDTWEPNNVPANAIWASSATGTTLVYAEG